MTDLIIPSRFCGPPSSGNGGYSAGAVDQIIQVNGVNLTTGFSTDQQIIADLLKRGKLLTDPGH